MLLNKNNESFEVEGRLFTMIEDNTDSEGEREIAVTAEINSVNIWDWLVMNNGKRINARFEVLNE